VTIPPTLGPPYNY